MIDVQEKKQKIISFLNDNGPSLPVRIAKAIDMDPVFASAILSEMLGSKQIKTSYMKIGSSPLYLLIGQEQKLEDSTDHLKSVEKEAFLKLREYKLLKDDEESPAIRVALRNIKDFAIPFKFKEKIMWKYAFANDDEIDKLIKPKENKNKKQDVDTRENNLSDEVQNKNTQNHTNAEDATINQDKVKAKKIENIFKDSKIDVAEPEFLIETKNFLKRRGIEFVEEIRTEKKEIMAVVSVTSQLGRINFLLIAKNKKTTTKDEINAAVQISTKNKMPCLLIIRKTPSRPIQKLIENNYLIKLEIMEEFSEP